MAGRSLTLTRTIAGTSQAFTIEDPLEMISWRSILPGASIWDRNAHVLRALQAQGVPAIDLLALALPSSWLVNARVSSRAMQRWLAEPAHATWLELLELLGFELSLEDFVVLDQEKRTRIATCIEKLATGEEGATLVALTKVLALLRPQLVPLMDDAALWFALELVPEPTTADAPAAPASAFLPLMDWFAREVTANEEILTELAAQHTHAILDAPQVLDRVLWVASWGNRARKKS